MPASPMRIGAEGKIAIMRAVWKILAGIAAVVVVVAIGIVVAVSTVDVNALIGPVRDRVKAATGRELTVRGGASLALSLQPKVVLNDVALGNAPWGSARDMVTVRRLELEVALLPLLSRRFELVEVILVEPVIALETDAKAGKNWEMPHATGASAASGDAAPSPPFGVGNIRIADGSLTFRDGASGSVTRVAIATMSLHARNSDSPIAVEFRGAVDDVEVAVEGTLGPIESLLRKRWPYAVNLKGEIAGQKAALSTSLRADDTRYSLDDLKIAFGANALTGRFEVITGGARPKLVFDLSGPVLVLSALPVPAPIAVAARAPATAPVQSGHRYLFPDTAINFAPLRVADAQGALALGKLTLPNGRQYEDLHMQFTLADGRLDVVHFSVGQLGGTVAGGLVLDARRPDSVAVHLRAEGKGLALGAILASVGQPREVRGGKTDVTVNLDMRGASMHGWASTATGTVHMVSGPATLVNTKVAIGSAWEMVSQAINPFRARDPSTELECAVVRLPLSNGVAKIDRSIAMETQKLGVSASGTLDFRDETLNFTFAPKARKGIALDFGSLADLVHVSGPFTAPQVTVDVAGSAKALASIGAAISTGGLSALGQALFAWSEGGGPGPCQIALGAAAPAATKPGGKDAGTSPIPSAEDIGKALGRLFGK
jgi:uncharacterized protein involved in outer membrane biogenesis